MSLKDEVVRFYKDLSANQTKKLNRNKSIAEKVAKDEKGKEDDDYEPNIIVKGSQNSSNEARSDAITVNKNHVSSIITNINTAQGNVNNNKDAERFEDKENKTEKELEEEGIEVEKLESEPETHGNNDEKSNLTNSKVKSVTNVMDLIEKSLKDYSYVSLLRVLL